MSSSKDNNRWSKAKVYPLPFDAEIAVLQAESSDPVYWYFETKVEDSYFMSYGSKMYFKTLAVTWVCLKFYYERVREYFELRKVGK